MKIIITEKQHDRLIKRNIEEDYPINWNVEEFRKLKSFSSRKQYCDKNLIRISSGSSRVVYKIDDTKVLKLAKNKKGLAQNEIEIDFSKDFMWVGIIAEIFNYDENNLWVEMELARKLTPKIFEEITGLNFEEYGNGLKYYKSETGNNTNSYKPSKPDSYDDMWENEFSYDIFNLIGGYDINVGDLTKMSTYGVVNRNGEDEVVMIDYGLTNKVYDSYYS
jgi:mRNA-degrading endonuclease RelE of RelBE toxin-antitoxin system